MRGYSTESGALSGIAGRLNSGSTGLEGLAAPPAVPDAGALTGPIAAVLATLTQNMAVTVEAVAAAGRAVTASDRTYTGNDTDAADMFKTT